MPLERAAEAAGALFRLGGREVPDLTRTAQRASLPGTVAATVAAVPFIGGREVPGTTTRAGAPPGTVVTRAPGVTVPPCHNSATVVVSTMVSWNVVRSAKLSSPSSGGCTGVCRFAICRPVRSSRGRRTPRPSSVFRTNGKPGSRHPPGNRSSVAVRGSRSRRDNNPGRRSACHAGLGIGAGLN
jgi:hypothetical protein